MLSDLVSGRQIFVKVMFPVEGRAALNIRVQSESGPNPEGNTGWIEALRVGA